MRKKIIIYTAAAGFVISFCLIPGIITRGWAQVKSDDIGYKDASPEAYSWVKYFDDPLLEAAVEELLKNNYDLQKTVARIEAAQAAVARAQANLKPAIYLRARALEIIGVENSDITTFAKGITADFAWDIDVWGEGKMKVDAERARRDALYADLDFSRQSLVAEMVKAWFLAVETRSQIALAEESVKNYRDILNIAGLKYEKGMISKQDIAVIKADLAQAEEAQLQAQGAYKEAVSALKLLLGRDPAEEIVLSEKLPDVLVFSAADIPSQLAQNRKDVLAAQYRRDASELNLKQTKKANYPEVKAESSINKLSKELNLLEDTSDAFATVGASAQLALFDGGRNKADIQAAGAEKNQAYIEYEKKSLEARHEIQAALANDELLGKRRQYLDSALADRIQDLELTRKRYEIGNADIVAVIYSTLKVKEAQVKSLHIKTAQLMHRADLLVLIEEPESDKGGIPNGN